MSRDKILHDSRSILQRVPESSPSSGNESDQGHTMVYFGEYKIIFERTKSSQKFGLSCKEKLAFFSMYCNLKLKEHGKIDFFSFQEDQEKIKKGR